jgi:hypothetical protein
VLSCMQLTVYRCRQCRYLLTTSRNVVVVQSGPGQEVFPFRKRDKAATAAQASGAGALFIEPMQWMQGLHEISGKLYCPKCVLSNRPPGTTSHVCCTVCDTQEVHNDQTK